jgi:hypothetical protein
MAATSSGAPTRPPPAIQILLNSPRRRLRYRWSQRANADDDICRGLLDAPRYMSGAVAVVPLPGAAAQEPLIAR